MQSMVSIKWREPRKENKATLLKNLHKKDYAAYLNEEAELDRRVIAVLNDGPMQQFEVAKAVNCALSHVQKHLDALVAQGCVSSLMVTRVCKLYFLPLDVSKSNSWDYEKQLYKRSRTPKEGGRSKRFTYLRLQD